jgi:oligosaccharide repeat unit polymerase
MYGIEDKLLAIIYSLNILVLAVGIRFVFGTFLIPAGIFALAWFAFTFSPLIILFSVPINSLAILYIFAAILSFSLGALPFNWRNSFRHNLDKSLYIAGFDSRFLKNALYISAFSSMLLSIIVMLINGFTIEQVVFDLVRTSGKYAAVRGTEGLEYGVIGVLSVMFMYICPVLGGLRVFAPRRKWFFLVSMAPSLFVMLTQSAKLVLLVSLCFYLSAAIVAKIYANRLELPKLPSLHKIIIWGGPLLILILLSFVSRLNEFNLEDLDMIFDPLLFSISSYVLGQIYAFADFFSYAVGHPSLSNYKNEIYSLGAYTFTSILDIFGFGREFPPGMYEESGWYPGVFETNIFTFFRGLIYDFGVTGSLLFLFIFSIFVHGITYQLLIKSRGWFFLTAYIVIVVFILMGYLFSIFVARYAFLSAAVIWVLLSLNAYNNRLYKS